jgi:hypothetical protein
VATIFSFAGVILEHSAIATGFLAAAIAVGGFIARAQALLGVVSEQSFSDPLPWEACTDSWSPSSSSTRSWASMSPMVRLLSIGAVASATVGVIIGLGVNAVDASGEVGGIAFVLGACIAGLIGAAVSRRLPPPRRQP